MYFLLEIINSLRFFIGHISSRNSFPKPLTKAEEKYWLKRMLKGDACALDKLVEHNMRLVAHISKKYVAPGYEADDLISIGSIGLIKAIKSFNAEKSSQLVTYASRCIENEILMYLRATKKKRNEVSLSEPVGTDKEGNEVTLIDILSSNDVPVAENVDIKLQTEKLIGKINTLLDEREKKIIYLRYGIGGHKPLTQRETAKILNISRSYVSRLEKAAILKLKK